MSQQASAGRVTVTVLDERLHPAVAGVLADAVADGAGARLAEADATLWGDAAQPEASIRLGWLDATGVSRPLLPRLRQLVGEMAGEGLYHVVLAGMGGSSLAPEVITRSAGVGLTVLDTTDPAQVRRALRDRLEGTLVVVSSKSGGTIETDTHRRLYEQAFRDLGLTDAQIAQRFVVVTDPGSPLEKIAAESGYRAVFLADETVGGRYSALTAFGVVPSALAGADVEQLLHDADAVRSSLGNSVDNPGLLLGAAMGAAARKGRDKLVVLEADRGLVGFGDWAEQLIAESTGKEGTGVLPVVVEDSDSPGWATAGSDALAAGIGEPPGAALTVTGPLGAQFLVWEYATAFAGKVLGINPFDQPNVTESKENTARLLEKAGPDGLPVPEPLLTDGRVEVYAEEALVGSARTLPEVLDALLGQVSANGYLAVMAYLDRIGDAGAAGLRAALGRRLKDRQVTFGWGPRFLHSTGQFHKGGPQQGVFLQLTGAVTEDLAVPGRPWSLGTLQLAQALGDMDALTGRGRPAVRLHLTDRRGGLTQVLAAVSR
ncbi:MAG TPA: glucose-6-phosphate isomerase [Sporichthyaceae bacterium]|jgi:glucose-6-phosphate isomerase